MPAAALSKIIDDDPEYRLVEDILRFRNNPEGFIRYAFPWLEPHTGLENSEGPDKWQQEVCEKIKTLLLDGTRADTAIQIAIASGHGIGKTALLSMLIIWFMSTRQNPQIVVTANTAAQLSTKTWRELAKWHKMAINRHWFKWTATKFFNVEAPDTWFASAIPWTLQNSEAFAGTHEKDVLIIYDEGSAIEDKIYEVTQGAMTTPGAMWLVFGNPTRNTGRFRECWGRFAHRWETMQIDSRTAKMANINQINEWVEDYGEDSDFVRIRVRGVFPRGGANQFISGDVVRNCMLADFTMDTYTNMPVVIGVDVARYGDDRTVFCIRQGRKVHPLIKVRGWDLMKTADKVMELSRKYKPTAVFVDGIGVGAGVVDRCRQMGYDVIDVNVAEKAYDEKIYWKKREEIWGRMRDALCAGMDIPDDPDLEMDLTAPEYSFDDQQRIKLERKEVMKERGLDSPDTAESLALTYSEYVIAQTQLSFEPEIGL